MGWDPDDRAAVMKAMPFVIGFIGLFGFCMVVDVVIRETRIFIDPKFDGFWADVERYHLQPASQRQSKEGLEELSQKYDSAAVETYFRKPSLQVAYLPSEDAAFVNILVVSLANTEGTISLSIGWMVQLILLYLPMNVGFRLTQDFLSRLTCLTASAARVRAAYFAELNHAWIKSSILTFVLIFSLSCLNAALKMPSKAHDMGVSVLGLATGMVFLAYFGGLYIKVVSYVVDLSFLVVGLNPHHSLWDELITVVIVSPVLWYVYNNSCLTIASNIVAGIGTGLFVKWAFAHRERLKVNPRTINVNLIRQI